MSAQHTPGPWEAKGRFILAKGGSDTFNGAVLAPIAEATDTNFMDADGRHWATTGTPEGNACFIAHAANCFDELLVALEGAIGALEQDVETGADYNDSDWSGIANERLAAAKAAIAKARGEVA